MSMTVETLLDQFHTFEREYKKLESQYKDMESKMKDCKVKMDVILKSMVAFADLIPTYGGEAPDLPNDNRIQLVSLEALLNPQYTELDKLPWKDKVIKALESLDKKSTVKDIVDWMKKIGTSMSDEKIHKGVTLYTSKMSINEEIGSDKSGYPHLYFIETDKK